MMRTLCAAVPTVGSVFPKRGPTIVSSVHPIAGFLRRCVDLYPRSCRERVNSRLQRTASALRADRGR